MERRNLGYPFEDLQKMSAKKWPIKGPFRELQKMSAKKGPIKGSEKKQDRLRTKFLCSKLDRRDVGDENGYKQFLKSLLAHIKTNMQVLPNDN